LEEQWDMLEQLFLEQKNQRKQRKKLMRECGIHVVDSPAQIGAKNG